MSIPASALVTINPSVIAAAGAAVDTVAVMLTQNAAFPLGVFTSVASADAISKKAGATSVDAQLATIYFNGYTNRLGTPASLGVWRYAETAQAAALRSASVASLGLSGIQALSGSLSVVVNGTAVTSASNINLSAATSFSNAAQLIQAEMTGVAVTYDSTSSTFLFTSPTTGAESTIAYATGTLAAGLLLTSATAATLSQGADAMTPATAMAALKAASLNWVSFFTTWEPTTTEKVEFSAWTSSQSKRFIYAQCDSDASVTTSSPSAESWGPQVEAASYAGSVPIYQAATAALFNDKAAFLCGAIASLDFSALNGRPTFAFKSQDGLTADVTDETIAANLIANGYNFYGTYATATTDFTWFYPGSVSGDYDWIDPFVCQVVLNANLQQSILTLFSNTPSVPYNAGGYALIEAAALDPITTMLNFGGIRTGVSLSTAEAEEVKSAAGVDISSALTTKGFYFQCLDPGATVRAARGTPICNLWYMDGGAVQSLTMGSVLIQ